MVKDVVIGAGGFGFDSRARRSNQTLSLPLWHFCVTQQALSRINGSHHSLRAMMLRLGCRDYDDDLIFVPCE